MRQVRFLEPLLVGGLASGARDGHPPPELKYPAGRESIVSPRRRHRHEPDQVPSEAEQTAADADQTAADTDQGASDRDQAAAEADQRASDRDQAASDLSLIHI